MPHLAKMYGIWIKCCEGTIGKNTFQILKKNTVVPLTFVHQLFAGHKISQVIYLRRSWSEMSRKAQREESDDQKMRIPTSPMGRLRTTVPEDDACVQKKGLENRLKFDTTQRQT